MKTLTHARISLRQLLKPSGKTCFISPERGFRRCPVRPQYILNPVKRALAARGESLAAFDERCIPASGVAPPSNTPGILSRRALPAGRLARLRATPDFHHGLLEAYGFDDRADDAVALAVEIQLAIRV